MFRPIFLIVLLFFVFSSCNQQAGLEAVKIDYLLNDGNSKVWMISEEYVDNQLVSPQNQNFKNCIIFYADNQMAIQPLNSFGNRKPNYATYIIRERFMTIKFKNDVKQFEVIAFTKDRIELESIQENEQLILIPLPKL